MLFLGLIRRYWIPKIAAKIQVRSFLFPFKETEFPYKEVAQNFKLNFLKKKKKKKKFVKIADTNFKCTTKSFSSHPFTIASVHLVLFCLCLFGCFVFFAFLFHLFFSLSLILIIGIFYCLNYILLLLSLQCTLYHIYLFHLSFSLSLQ